MSGYAAESILDKMENMGIGPGTHFLVPPEFLAQLPIQVGTDIEYHIGPSPRQSITCDYCGVETRDESRVTNSVGHH